MWCETKSFPNAGSFLKFSDQALNQDQVCPLHPVSQNPRGLCSWLQSHLEWCMTRKGMQVSEWVRMSAGSSSNSCGCHVDRYSPGCLSPYMHTYILILFLKLEHLWLRHTMPVGKWSVQHWLTLHYISPSFHTIYPPQQSMSKLRCTVNTPIKDCAEGNTAFPLHAPKPPCLLWPLGVPRSALQWYQRTNPIKCKRQETWLRLTR